MSGWQVHRHEGYRAIIVDVTAFWRPKLRNCPSKHYHPAANRALPAVIFGVIGEVGPIGDQRLACPLAFERVHPKDPSESRLWQELLLWARRHLAADDVAVMDAGVKLANVQAAGQEGYLLHLATNFTARRNQPMPYGGKGRKPVYGEKIRPLERSYKGKTIAASSPDRVETWTEDGVEIRAEIWEDLILPGVVPGPQAKTFRVYAIYNPAYTTPWLLATPLNLKAATVRAMYQDRWPVEEVPLSAKQRVGAHRQFVHADESIQRLPELALLAGSILSFLAATAPLAPTGFWDRQPKRTPGGASAGCSWASHFRNFTHCQDNFAKRHPHPAIYPRGAWLPDENSLLQRHHRSPEAKMGSICKVRRYRKCISVALSSVFSGN